jgi:multiple sugar transport system ATP-binding protein
MNLLERDAVLVGFRPERFLPQGVTEGQGQRVLFSFRVTRVEYLGADRLLYGFVGGYKDAKAVARLPSTVTSPVEPGKTYDFVVQAKELKFFDKATGTRTEPKSL